MYVFIDDFDELPDDLALVICKELKGLDDSRSLEQFEALRPVRFIMGGAIDFQHLYSGKVPSGVSPATNFSKYRPADFLLSDDEATSLLEDGSPWNHAVSTYGRTNC